ncbi:ImmA/IrrE family metallo-endopeptidase [Tardiphaga sp. 619_E2_N8_5]|uniref:ImmA/IrrE family metallo-endopeptidase n=1 Tax=unclassified Tardiphaga TaxID=2631404 RepID=UPI003F27ADA8
MSRNRKDEIFLSLVDDLFQDLQATCDDDIVSEFIEDVGEIDAVLADIRSEIHAAITSVAKDKLSHARSAVLDYKARPVVNEVDAKNAKRLLDEFLSSEDGRSRLTMAARKGRGSAETDMISALSDLCHLQSCGHSGESYNFGSSPKAEHILRVLGVTDPAEIDVEAIAWHLGAEVRYEALQGCEARIIGTDNAAVITVNKASSRQRQRFSICHELGHWIYHRRRILLCQGSDIERPSLETSSVERAADRFASELLMPSYLFVPMAESFGRPSMSAACKLSRSFNTSQTAATIRLVETSALPMFLVCHAPNGRKWFARSKVVADDWFPNNDLSPESSAFTMIYGKAPNAMPTKSVSASAWFSRRDASRYEVTEESFRVGNDEVLVLLAFKNPHKFLEDQSHS